MVVAASASVWEDAYTPAIELTDGYQPGLAIDPKDGTLHLVFLREGRFIYQTRSPSGVWSAEEPMFTDDFYDTGGLNWDDTRVDFFDPRIKLDGSGVPHLVFSRGLWQRGRSFYTNRIGDYWKEPLRFPSPTIVTNRSINADLAIAPDGTVFVTAFNFWPVNNWVVRLADVAEHPVIEAEVPTRFVFGTAAVMTNNAGELWVFGGQHGDKPWYVRQYNPQSLGDIGDPIDLAPFAGEQARAVMDHHGEIHAAGGKIWDADNPGNIGWYQSVSRAKAGLPPIRFMQHMGHACGAVLPVRDLAAENRVYLFGWSGQPGNHHNELGPLGEYNYPRSWFTFTENQLRFARIEDGALVAAHRRVTDLPGAHGPPYRNTPAVAAIPGGGVAVVFCRAESPEAETSRLYYTEVGRPPLSETVRSEEPAAPMP